MVVIILRGLLLVAYSGRGTIGAAAATATGRLSLFLFAHKIGNDQRYNYNQNRADNDVPQIGCQKIQHVLSLLN